MIKLARTLVLPLALAVAVGACDKGKGGGGGGGGATGAAGASAIAPAQGGLKRALAAMPADTDIIVGLDFNQLRKSELWKKYEPQVLEKASKGLEEFKAVCGFDPMAKVTGALIGMKGPGPSDKPDMTVFVRGFQKTESIECLKKAAEKSKTEADGKSFAAAVDGDLVEITPQDGEVARFLFVDDQTALFIMKNGASADKATLTAAAAAKDGDGLTSSKAFVSLLDSTKTGSSLWWLVNGAMPAISDGASQIPGAPKFKAIFGSVNVGSGIEGVLNLRMSDKSGVDMLKGMATMGLKQAEGSPMTADLVKSVKVTSNDSDVIVSFKYDQKTLEQIVSMAQSMGRF